jgi:hypothetical protein
LYTSKWPRQAIQATVCCHKTDDNAGSSASNHLHQISLEVIAQ